MFGGNIRPSHGRTRDVTHGASGHHKHLEDNRPQGPGNGELEPEARGVAEGDGYHHHQIDENESGLHSVHIHPDGREEHADHATTKEALHHAHQMFEGEDAGRDDMREDESHEHSEDADEGPDFSARYRQ